MNHKLICIGLAVSVSVFGGQPQTISFPPLENLIAGSPPAALAATSDSGLPVQYAVVSGEKLVSLDDHWIKLTGLTGTVTVEAAQSGNEIYAAAAPVRHTFIVSPTPGAPVKLTDCGGIWTWFNDERAIIADGKLITGYVDNDGYSGVSSYDLQTHEMSFFTLSTWRQKDDHDNAGFCRLPDGRILALYARHASTLTCEYRVTDQPGDISAWSDEQSFSIAAGNVTYSNPHMLSAETNRIYNFFRGDGSDTHLIWSDDLGANWASAVRIFDTLGRPYVKYCSDGISRIDLAFTSAHPGEHYADLHHMYYQSGNFYQTDGTLITSLSALTNAPITPWAATMVYDMDGPSAIGRPWILDVAHDRLGRPVIVFSTNYGSTTDDFGDGADIRYFHARWDGSAGTWILNQIAYAGSCLYEDAPYYSGGVSFDPDDPSGVYLSSNVNPADGSAVGSGAHEIYKASTVDGGGRWTYSAITANSPEGNYRPFVPGGHGSNPCLLWFRGSYPTYSSYKTHIYATFSDELINAAPIVSLKSPGRDIIYLPDSETRLHVELLVEDDTLEEVTCRWSTASGPFDVGFGATNASVTFADFPGDGIYHLRATADDGSIAASRDLTVYAGTRPQPPATNNLVLHLGFDEGAGVGVATNDSSSLGNNAVWSGAPSSLLSGAVDKGVFFNGVDTLATVADNSSLDPVGAFTLGFWMKPYEDHTGGLVSKRESISSGNAFTAYYANKKVNIDINGSSDRFTSLSLLEPGQWHHVVLIFDGSLPEMQRARLYIDGELDRTAKERSATIENSAAPVLIGLPNVGHTGFFHGGLDDIRLYMRVLTDSDVAALWSLGCAAPLVGAAISPSEVSIGSAVQMNGSGGDAGIPVFSDSFENGVNNTDNTDGYIGDANFWPDYRTQQYGAVSGTNALVVSGAAGGGGFIKYFESPQTLAAGDTITLKWHVRDQEITGTDPFSRVGFFKKGAATVTDYANGGTADPAFTDYTGYYYNTIINRASTNAVAGLSLYKRNPTTSETLLTPTDASSMFLDTVKSYHERMTSAEWTPEQTVAMTRTETGWNVVTVLGGDSDTDAVSNSFSFADAFAITEFDGVSIFYSSGGANTALIYDDVSVFLAGKDGRWFVSGSSNALDFISCTGAVTRLPGLWDVRYQRSNEVCAVSAGTLLTVTDRYAAWAERYELSASQNAEGDDPDEDSVVNLIEYASGTDPSVANSGGGLGGQSFSSVTVSGGTNLFNFVYYRNRLLSDLIYSPQVNSNLTDSAGWVPIAQERISVTNPIEVWRVRMPLDAMQGFMRLRVGTE